MNIRAFTAAAVALFACVASEAAAQSPAASDFSRFCVQTRASSVAAFTAADIDGWSNDTIDAPMFVRLTGSAEGREINRGTTAFRALTAGQRTGADGIPRRSCALVSQETFEVVSTELIRLMPIEVGARTDRQLTWNYMYLDGTPQSLDHMSSEQAVAAGATGNPMIQVVALAIEGGVIMLFTESDFRAARTQ